MDHKPRAKPGPKRLPEEQRTHPRSIRTTDARWETLTTLGVSEWLEPLLDRERERMEREGWRGDAASTNTCCIEGCGEAVVARGFCMKHYQRCRRHGHPRAVKCEPNPRGGLSKHPLYKTWYLMMEHCYNPKDSRYHNYGARGITVCERWHDIAAFVADVGEKPAGKRLYRIDDDGPYSPDNCWWGTPLQRAQKGPQETLTGERREVMPRQRGRAQAAGA